MDTPTPAPPASKIPTILLVISILGLLATTAILAYQIFSLQKQISILESKINTKPKPTPTTIPSPTIDVTADWKTYSNTKYGYSFQFPPDWQVRLFAGSQLQAEEANSFAIETIESGLSLTFTVENAKDHDLFADKTKTDNLVLNGITWDYLSGDIKYCDGGECSMISNALRSVVDNKRFTLILGTVDYKDPIITQILSTFKLTNSKGKFCGGIAELACPSGFYCKLDGSYPDASGKCVASNQDGTLEAVVIVSPTCPGAMRPGDSCEGPYSNHNLNIVNLTDKKTITVKTDKDGKFTTSLTAGSYKLQNTSTGIGKDIRNPNFTIITGKTVSQRFDIDTGIR